MVKILKIALLGSLLLLGAAKSVSGECSAFKAPFCPECWTYLWGGGSLDLKGNCAECGKYPVELDVRRMSWWWCTEDQRWSATECPQNARMHCCTEEESVAAVVAAGPGTFEAWYCPDHRSFRVYRLPILMQVVCRTCARPAVKVFGVERSWFWCRNEGRWAPTACPMNPVQGCCVQRGGTLLAQPESGPLAR
jgi:hypothetical protein